MQVTEPGPVVQVTVKGVHPEAAKGVMPMMRAMRILLKRDIAHSVLVRLCRASQLDALTGKIGFREKISLKRLK